MAAIFLGLNVLNLPEANEFNPTLMQLHDDKIVNASALSIDMFLWKIIRTVFCHRHMN